MLSASIVVSVVLLLLAAGAYIREHRRGAAGPGESVKDAIGLFALRAGVIIILFLLLSGLVIRYHWTRPGRVVAVLKDVSRSMTLTGADTLARQALEHMSGLIDARLEPFAFAETTLAVRSDPMTAAVAAGLDGSRTMLGSALAAVAGLQPGAILLLTDGRDNGAIDPVREADRHGIPVYAVGCGPRRTTNLMLSGLRVPDEIHAGETTRVQVRVEWSGLESASAAIELNGRQRQLRFDAPGTQDVEFGVVFPEPGFHRLYAVAESIPGEVTTADNRLETVGHVRPGRVRVQYLTDTPGPSSRYITRALERLPRVSLVRDIIATPGGLAAPGAADVFVLDRIQAGPDWPGWARVVEAVRSGAGLLVVNEREFAAGHPLARFVPGGATALRGSVRILPQPGHPAEELGRAIERLPPVEPAVVPAQPDSFEPWWRATAGARPVFQMEANDSTRTTPDDPVVAGSRRFGQGRVLYLGWPVWSWGFSAGEMAGAPTVLEQMLTQAVRYLSTRTDELLRFIPTRPEFMSGDPVHLELTAIATDGRPLTAAAPAVTVRLRDQAPGSRPLTPEPGPLPMVELGGGRYRIEITGLTAGEYEAVATTAAGETNTAFIVAARSREELLLGLDDRLLRAIARVSGGQYFDGDSLPGSGFEPELRPSRRGFEFTPRRSVWTYLVLVLLAGSEWALRRRKGLM